MKYHVSIIFILIISELLFAQTDDSTAKISDQLIEDVTPEPVVNNEEFNVIDYLEDLQKNPINLNTADLTTLQKIPGLNLNYATLIIKFREKYGHYFSNSELYTVKGLPKNVISNIKLFITVIDPIKQSVNVKTINNSIFNFVKIFYRTRISENLNNINNLQYTNYPGSRLKLYNKLALHNEQGEAGILTEKDPGEKSYYDFISFHFFLKKIGFFDKIILGDYICEFGQGLVLGGPYSFSKTTKAAFTNKSQGNIFHPYNSTDESRFFRGIAVSAIQNDIQFSLFYSNHYLDASTDSITGNINSLITSGDHRTSSELNNHNSLKENTWGGSMEYLYNNIFHLGVLYCSSKFSKPLSSSLLYAPQGYRFNYLSTSYGCSLIPSIYISGETAYDTKAIASINTIELCFNKNFLFVSSIRSYPRNFNSLHGNSLAEQKDKVQNETGFYNGFKLLTNLGTINFYYDQFKFPFGSYRFPISNTGEEFLFSYLNTFEENINVNLNYKYENKDYVLNQDDQKSIARRGRNDIRAILTWSLSKGLRLKSISEYNVIRIKETNATEKGILLSNSIIINLIKGLKVTGVISFFKTDSFFSSVYEYDNNIEGLARGEILYGEGMKLKLYLSYNVLNELTISAQYSEISNPKVILASPSYSTLTDNIIFQIEFLL
jgi:hypothetical protein